MSVPETANNGEKNLATDVHDWRRKCGCLKTSQKLRQLLDKFPAPPPPTPLPNFKCHPSIEKEKGRSGCCQNKQYRAPPCYLCPPPSSTFANNYNYGKREEKRIGGSFWQIVAEAVQLVQLSVTATALALYYIIYCYMQLVYYTLRSALYFHNADVPMKITIAIVTLTSIIVGMNLLMRMERVIGLR